MISLENIREFIKETDPKEAYEVLVDSELLNRQEKSLLYSWYFPKRYLDGDLVKNMSEYRSTHGYPNGTKDVVPEEVGILLEAFKGSQYENFIRHLFHALCHSQVFPLQTGDENKRDCCVCGRKLHYYPGWENLCRQYPQFGEQDKKDWLAFGSNATTVCICSNCLIQLHELEEVLNFIDPDILNYKKHESDGPNA